MRKIKGFTLLELMITVAVVAVLVSLALPSYRAFVLRSNRTAAMEAILTAAACEERIYSRTGQYIYDNTCKSTPDGYNKLAITNLNTGQGFRIVAIPNGLGSQIQINIEYVNSISRAKNGKFKWVVSSIEPTFN